ncbi:hypothetical protein LCGC14_1678850, partial [marine sediment metagenome]
MLKINNKQTNDYLIRQLPSATLFINQMFEVVHVSDRWISYFKLDTLTVLG